MWENVCYWMCTLSTGCTVRLCSDLNSLGSNCHHHVSFSCSPFYPPPLLFIRSAPFSNHPTHNPSTFILPSHNPSQSVASTVFACHFYLSLPLFPHRFPSTAVFPLPLLYTVLFHFTFFLPDWHFSSSDPHPISLNLFLVCCLRFPSALFSSIYFSPFFSAHPPLFSLKPYLLPFSVAGYKTLPQPPSACLCMKADTVIDVLTL